MMLRPFVTVGEQLAAAYGYYHYVSYHVDIVVVNVKQR